MLYQCRRYQGRIHPSLSRHAIPRRLQDTALPLHLAITPLSLNSPRRERHYPYRRPCYRIYALIPRRRTRSLTTPGPRTQYRLPCYGYIGTLLCLHSSTSASVVSHGYYKQIRPTGVDPDLTSTPFLIALVAQPSAIEYRSSQYWSFSCTQGMVSGQLYPSLLLDLLTWQVGSTSLQDEVVRLGKGSRRRRSRTPGAAIISSLSH
jgi:hypothetical protein